MSLSRRREDRGKRLSACALAFLAGNVLLLSSALVSHGLLILLIAILAVDGFGKIIAAWRRSGADRFPLVFNGLIDFGCATLIWHLSRFIGVVRPLASSSAPTCSRRLADADGAGRIGHSRFGHQSPERPPGPRTRRSRERDFCPFAFRDRQRVEFVRAADLMWMSTLGIVFLAIHAGRMPLPMTCLVAFSVRCHRRRHPDDARLRCCGDASGAPSLASPDKAGGTPGVVPASWGEKGLRG